MHFDSESDLDSESDFDSEKVGDYCSQGDKNKFLAKYSFLETTANFKEQAIQGVGLMVIRDVIGLPPFSRNNKEAI